MFLFSSLLRFPLHFGVKYRGEKCQNDSKLDFEYKSIPQIQSNIKVTQKTSKITTSTL